jgi:hypothetical protein
MNMSEPLAVAGGPKNMSEPPAVAGGPTGQLGENRLANQKIQSASGGVQTTQLALTMYR